MTRIYNRRQVFSFKKTTIGFILAFLHLSEGSQNRLIPRAGLPTTRTTSEIQGIHHNYPYSLETIQQQQKQQQQQRHPTNTISRSGFLASAVALMALPAVAKDTIEINNNLNKISLESVAVVTTSSTTISNAASKAMSTSQQESISGLVAGASLSTVKTLVKFPLDTATVRLQLPNSDYSLLDLPRLFRGSFSGVTLSLLSNIPGGAVFFAVKDATKASLKNSALSTAPRWLTTTISVAAALVPYWIIRNPSEVIKVRQQAGIEGYGDGVSPLEAIQMAIKESNNGTALEIAQEFYTGYFENILYGLPADVIKFVAYEAITDGRKDLSPAEGAVAGALATAVAQFLTTPQDVVRNRLMTGKDQNGIPISEEEKNQGYIQSLVALAKEEGAKGFFAGASPRVAKAFLSGAIQFATYEETKQSIARLLQR